VRDTSQPDPGALSISPADGYQYGDDHPWSGDQQAKLVTRLDELIASLTTPTQDTSTQQ
jgi:hypothetical protein